MDKNLVIFVLLWHFCVAFGQELRYSRVEIGRDLHGSRGVSLADLDGNGYLDVVVANEVDSTLLSGNIIYFNFGNVFKSKAIAAGDAGAWSESVHTVDVDDDGDLDLFFTTQFNSPNLLYLNDGKGAFAAANAGDLTSDLTNSPGACWCDYDSDGDMDVFLLNRDGQDDNLYVNNGGIFKRALSGPWLGNGGDGRACAWGDLNGDGKPDLYVVNFVVKEEGRVTGKHRNFLYVADSDGGIHEQREGILAEEKNASYGVSLVDFDYDKDLDVYVTNVSATDANAYYENLGSGEYQKVENTGIAHEIHRPSKGQCWGDFNNDGLLDLYIANGTENYPEIQNFYFLGTEDHAFKRVYNTLPAIEGHISAGTATGDFDNDGDLDLYVCNWGGDAEENDYYVNESTGNSWLKISLRGTQSNRFGIGSWVILTLDDGSTLTRYVSRETGYGSENAPEVHFGFPKPKKIAALRIEWPSGILQEAGPLQGNRWYEIMEGRDIKTK